VWNDYKVDCFDIFKNCGLDNTATSRYSSDGRSARGYGTCHNASHPAARHKTAAATLILAAGSAMTLTAALLKTARAKGTLNFENFSTIFGHKIYTKN
jgi:hypothetical protein